MRQRRATEFLVKRCSIDFIITQKKENTNMWLNGFDLDYDNHHSCVFTKTE